MPNIKSAMKRVKVSKRQATENTFIKSSLKTMLKKCKESIELKNENAGELIKKTFKSLDKAVAKGIFHKNTVSRKKSKLAQAYNKVINN